MNENQLVGKSTLAMTELERLSGLVYGQRDLVYVLMDRLRFVRAMQPSQNEQSKDVDMAPHITNLNEALAYNTKLLQEIADTLVI